MGAISSRLVSQTPTHTHTHILLCHVFLGFLQPLFQEADVSGCGGVLEAAREAESCPFLLWFHGGLVQEEVGIDVVHLRPGR